MVLLKSDDEVKELKENKNWLRVNAEPRSKVRELMERTRVMRCQWVHGPDQPGLGVILDQYPRLCDKDGYNWVYVQYSLLSVVNTRFNSFTVCCFYFVEAGEISRITHVVKTPSLGWFMS